MPFSECGLWEIMELYNEFFKFSVSMWPRFGMHFFTAGWWIQYPNYYDQFIWLFLRIPHQQWWTQPVFLNVLFSSQKCIDLKKFSNRWPLSGPSVFKLPFLGILKIADWNCDFLAKIRNSQSSTTKSRDSVYSLPNS